MILESVIIGLLVLNLCITLYTEHKRMKITKKIAKEGQESINGFVQVFQSLDKKLIEAMSNPGADMGADFPTIHFHTMPAQEEKKVKNEQVEKITKNIETYITNLKYARENFASTASEKKVIDTLIRNIKNNYGGKLR